MAKLFCLVLGIGLSPWMVAASGEAQRHTTLKVLNQLHFTNQKELQLGQIAQEKGSTLQIRNLGENLIRDHQNADQAVTQLAQRSGIGLQSHAASTPEVRRLRSLSGAEFDRTFAQVLIEDHQTDLQALRTEQEALPSSDVRELVRNFLPTLEKHLAWAENFRG